MTALAALALGLVVGAVIGGLGGGGGVLTVPVLVYLLGLTAQDATTSSVIVVGVTAAVGALLRLRAGAVDVRTAVLLAASGAPAAVAGTVVNGHVSERTLLLSFAALTVTVAGLMLLDRRPPEPAGTGPGATPAARGSSAASAGPLLATPAPAVTRRVAAIAVCGIGVGFLTGFLGVGGGFLVVPALVLVLRIPMTVAVGTSLLVITLNAAASGATRLGVAAAVDWAVVVPFTLAAVLGALLATRVAGRFTGPVLTRAFAVLILVIGLAVGAQSLLAG